MIRSARRASHIMALVGLASLAVTGQIGAGWVAVGASAVAASLIADAARLSRVVPSRLTNGLILAALGFAITDYLWLSPTLLHVGTHLLIVLMLTRLRHENAREYLHLVAIVFLQMVAAAGLSPHGTFNAGFVAYLPVMVWVLVQYHLLSEAERSPSSSSAPPVGLAPWTAAAALAAMGAASVLFFFLPRMGLELLGVIPQQDVRLSGFSAQVRLGAIGPVKRDPTIVMRVTGQAVGAGGPSLYLRGAVFDAFDGQSWLATAPVRRLVRSDGEGRFAVGRVRPGTPSLSIRAEPLDTTVLFTPERTAAVAGPFAALMTDDEDIFNLPYPPGIRQTYDVWQFADGDPKPVDAAVSDRYRQWDESARLAELAEHAVSGAASARDRAHALERFLRTRYTYTLDVPSGESRPVETFLFERRSGYCEHFASAMALMLRALGIPSRLVTGFLVTEWNAFGDYAIVRQGDAHAWVEAYLPGLGWTRFDPTPPAPASDRPWENRLAHYVDSLRTGWDRYVLDFTLSDQHEALTQAERMWEGLQARVEARLTGMRQRLAAIADATWAIGGVIAVALALLGAWARGRRWPAPRPRRGEPSAAFYQRLLRALERQGVRKPPTVTPREFAVRHASCLQSAEAIQRVTERYYQVRYGRRTLSSVERKALESDLASIEREG